MDWGLPIMVRRAYHERKQVKVFYSSAGKPQPAMPLCSIDNMPRRTIEMC
jgi:hypothetical protein